MSSPAVIQRRPWPLRIVGFLVFIVVFTRELILANIDVAIIVLFKPVSSLAPEFITYPLEGLTEFEIVVLSHCITLTPGTTSVDVSEDQKRLTVHALNANDPQAVCDGIKQKLEKPLLAWTR